MMRIGFDSSVLIYAAGGERITADLPKIARAQQMLVELADVAELVAPVQSIGEAVRILSFSMRKSDPQVSATLNKWNVLFETVPTTIPILANALQFARQHGFRHWDSVIVCATVEADCSILLSEDMQDGFVWRGLTVINPFAATVHPLLASLVEP